MNNEEYTDIVINACYGGFSLSEAAILRYAEIKGIPIWIERKEKWNLATYWTIPPEEREKNILEDEEWHKASLEERREYNKWHDEHTISGRDISRTDPALAQVVKELGNKADGRCAELVIVTLAKGTKYYIDEYDGYESVVTPEDLNWEIA